jgi:hypothetical protein
LAPASFVNLLYKLTICSISRQCVGQAAQGRKNMRSRPAALPRHFVKIVKISRSRSNDKTGKRLVRPIATTTFWENQPDCGGFQFRSDSVVIYDRQADRRVTSRPGESAATTMPGFAGTNCAAVSNLSRRRRRAQLGISFFGDNSRMTVDPTDDCSFLYTNTYIRRPRPWTSGIRGSRLSGAEGAGEPKQQARAARLHRRSVRGVV